METVELSSSGSLNYEFLRNLLSQERSQNPLSSVKEDFFDECERFLQSQERLLREDFSMEKTRVFENSKKIVLELRDVRLRKLLFKAWKDFESSSVNSSGLAFTEKEFYRSLISLLNDFKARGEKDEVKIKILVDLPKLQAPDGSALGPFTAGQIVNLGQQAAELLLQKNAAEKA
ncbi:MAG: hypothetical protein V1717_02025 [Candidatus Micrarchaeota archaeon]